MREGFNTLRDRLAAIYESEGGKLFTDPWAARNDYIEVMLSPAGVDAFLAKHLRDQSQAASVRQRALALLEMQKFGMYSFTSCAWFFDHMDGIEPVQNMRYAARAIQLADELVDGEGGKLEEELLVTLARGQSKSGSGRDIWNNQVRKLAVARQLEGILSARLNEPVRVRKVTALVATARALKIPFDVNRAQEQLLAAYAAEVEMAGETPLAAELVTAYQEAAGSLELASGLLGWNEAGFDIRHRRSLSRRPTTPREVSMSARRRTHAGWRQ